MAASRASSVQLVALAGAVHLALDGLLAWLPFAAPPHLLLDHAGEAFRAFLQDLGRGPVLGTVAVLVSAVNGIVAALMAVAFEGHPRRRRLLAWTLFALWVGGGGVMILVYLSPPWWTVVGSLAAGAPRAWLVAWALDRVLPRPEPERAPAAGTT